MDEYELAGLLHHLEISDRRPPFKPIRSVLLVCTSDEVRERIAETLPDATVETLDSLNGERFDLVFVDDAHPAWEWVRAKANLMAVFHNILDEKKMFWAELSARCPYTTVITCQEEDEGGFGIVYLQGVGVHHPF